MASSATSMASATDPSTQHTSPMVNQENGHNLQSPGPDIVQVEDENEQDDDDDDDDDSDENDETERLVTWTPLFDFVKSHVQEASSHAPSISPEDATAKEIRNFQRYWRDVYTGIIAMVEANPGIPEKLCEPSPTAFRIWVFSIGKDAQGISCPCCLPDTGDDIVIENEEGVGKSDFVRAIATYLYGDDETLPYLHDEDDGVAKKRGVSTIDFNYMMETSSESGQKILYRYRPPGIWLYCNPAGG